LGRSKLKISQVKKGGEKKQNTHKKELTRRNPIKKVTKKTVVKVAKQETLTPDVFNKDMQDIQIVPQIDAFTSVSYYDKQNIHVEDLVAIAAKSTDNTGFIKSFVDAIKDMYKMIVNNATVIEYNKNEIKQLHATDKELDKRIYRLEKEVF